MMLLPLYDWSPWFGGWDVDGLITATVAGAVVLVPLVVARVGFAIGVEFLRRLGRFVR